MPELKVLDPPPQAQRSWRPKSGATPLVVIGLAAILGRHQIAGLFDSPAVLTWLTVFVALIVQAVPFLVLGVLLAGTIATFLPAHVLRRLLPDNPLVGVPAATAAGAVLPGCECASVPVAGSLIKRGISPAAAFAFLLAAPAINPIVLVSTAVAFPGRPEFVGARFAASVATAMVMGWLWARFGRTDWLRLPTGPGHEHEGASRFATFRLSVEHDLLHAGGFLVLGAMIAATVNTVVPAEWVQAVADRWLIAVIALALLAFLVAICSEADAFVAASFSMFPNSAKLAFMVVGPAVDVKLASMQAGTFGPRFAVRFAPATFVVAVLSSLLVGWWLL